MNMPTQSTIDRLAKVLWDYHHLNNELRHCDAILALCSFDRRVAERAAQLFLDGLGRYLIFSGGVGRNTEGKFDQPEAQIFADIARQLGVPSSAILVEDQSTNTGENILFIHRLLAQRGLRPRSLILVQKPYMERRTYATFKKQWPGGAVDFLVTSPQIDYDNYFDQENPAELVINVMVGNLQRIKEYPKAGYQIEQEIPSNVWDAYEELIQLGYDKQLI
jgi:uncharacterized SAM-binding protein YcdF (DUF218 family)